MEAPLYTCNSTRQSSGLKYIISDLMEILDVFGYTRISFCFFLYFEYYCCSMSLKTIDIVFFSKFLLPNR